MFFVAVAASLAAQTPPVFRGGVDLVEMDVSVLDANRRPVRGLLAGDFTVLEDGKPQAVSLFSEVDVPGPDPVAAPWMRDVGPDVTTNIPADRRLVVIVMDDATVQNDAYALVNAKKIGRSIVNHLGPGDLASVVFTRDNRNTQDFTTDHGKLLAAIDKFTVGSRDMGNAPPALPNPTAGVRGAPVATLVNTDAIYYQYSAQILGEIGKQLIDVPQRRKTVLYIGQGLPFDISTAAAVGTPGGSLGNNEIQNKILMEVAETIRSARQSNLNFYAFDVCGLRTSGGLDQVARTCQPGLEVEYLQTLAEGTGGRAIVNASDPERGIAEVFGENNSYYLLGFRSSNANPDKKLRRLDVRVNRPGLTVRTRSNYTPASANPRAQNASPMAKALAGVLPTPDIALQVHAAPFAQPGKDPRVAIVLGVHQSDLASATERVTENLSLQVMAFTPEGAPRSSFRQSATLGLRASPSGDIQYEMLTGMDLKPGRYQLRLAAESLRQHKNGSVYVDVTVPDFEKAPLSLSGVELAATPSPAAAPKTALAALMPIVPTSRREFRTTDRVEAFWKIYEGGKGPLRPVRLDIQLLGSEAGGQRATGQTATISPAQFDKERAAAHQFALDLGGLPPGPYLLRINAAAGRDTASRDVRIRILER